MVDFDPDEFLLRIASTFGVSYEQMSGRQETSAAEVEARVEAYRANFEKQRKQMELWDKAIMDKVINDAAFFMCIKDTPKAKLRHWRWEMKQGVITKRAWRRLRGRVRVGKDIPDPPALIINFEPVTTRYRNLAPFVSPLR